MIYLYIIKLKTILKDSCLLENMITRDCTLLSSLLNTNFSMIPKIINKCICTKVMISDAQRGCTHWPRSVPEKDKKYAYPYTGV